MKNRKLEKDGEGHIMVAQNQSLPTNVIEGKIDKIMISVKSRVCNEKKESVIHVISCCSHLTQKEYRFRHE